MDSCLGQITTKWTVAFVGGKGCLLHRGRVAKLLHNLCLATGPIRQNL